jgi:hypothetical protein
VGNAAHEHVHFVQVPSHASSGNPWANSSLNVMHGVRMDSREI